MWISNVASMTLMLPIVEAILVQMETNVLTTERVETEALPLEEKPLKNVESDDAELETSTHELTQSISNGDVNASAPRVPAATGDTERTKIEIMPHVDDAETMTSRRDRMRIAYFANVAKALTLSITYAGKCGGMATLTGTPANMIMKSQVDE